MELTTAWTDYILGLWCVILSLKLSKITRTNNQLAAYFFALAFLFLAEGAFTGGWAHEFMPDKNAPIRIAFWRITYLSIAGSQLFFLLGLSMAIFAKRFWIITLLVVGFIGYGSALWVTRDFFYVALGSAVTLFLMLILEAYDCLSKRIISSFWIMGGILVTFLAMLIQSSRLEVWNLDHNGIFHIIQMPGLYMLYRGGRLLEDKK